MARTASAKQTNRRRRLVSGFRAVIAKISSQSDQEHRGEHHDDVIDRPEPDSGCSHDSRQVRHRFGRERTQTEIENQAKEHLQVDRRHEERVRREPLRLSEARGVSLKALTVAATPSRSASQRVHKRV